MKTYNTYFSNGETFFNFVDEHGLRAEKTVLVQIFSSILDKDVLKKVIDDISDALPEAKIIGATTDGEILDNTITTDRVVVSITVFENSTLDVASEEENADSYFCGMELAKKLVSKKTKAMILFTEGYGINGEFFLDGVQSVSKDIPIAGGMAGDGATFTGTYVFCNKVIISHGAVGVSINSDKLHVNTAYSFNWAEIGKPLTITKAKDNRVYEIDGISAVEMYAKYLGKNVAERLPATGIEFPLILTRDGVKIARAVLGKNEDGSLIFAGNLEVGDIVYFGYGNIEMILNSSVHTRDKIISSPVESIFIYSCMARRRFLEDTIKEEITPLSNLAPTSGFFTYGEFFKSNKCELLNQTMTVLALSESDNINKEVYDYKQYAHVSDVSATQIALSHLTQVTFQELKKANDNLEKAIDSKTKELQDKITELEYTSKVKSDFLATMSHEIRTPLNAILGFIGLLKAEEKDKERIKRFNIVKNAGDTLLKIINDILDFSKIQSGKMLLERRKFSTKKPFKEVGALFYERAKEEGINLKIHFEENLPKFFVGDIVRIKQVASNLLSNAIKFTKKNGLIVMRVGYDEQKEELFFSVKDNGVGIDKKNLDKIFDSFTQEDTSTTRKFGGTGLGLSISSALIASMDGRLSVESVLGEGSEFTFYLPILEADELDKSLHVRSEKIDLKKKLTGKILLVEDNKTNQMLINIMLDDLDLDVELAENGLEAVEMFKKSKYDLILMDESMPRMSGIEATKIILEIEQNEKLKHTPIVALTANALAHDRERFLKAGMDEFVAKPIDHEQFVKVLHTFLL